MQCKLSIRQSILVDELCIPGLDGVEVARNEPTTASRFAEEVGKDFQLLGPGK